MEISIKNFLKITPYYSDGDGDGYGNSYGSGYGDGDGYGYGDGCSYGDGYGYGNGDGSGHGNGDGYGYGNGCSYGGGSGGGYGNGYGNGDECGIKEFNGEKVYLIDFINTIIINVKKNIAQGFILNSDMTLEPCYIVKNDNYHSHGKSLKEAMNNLSKKTFANLNFEDKIKEFKIKFNDLTKKYNAEDFFEWHYYLTGSCEMGRRNWCKNHNINIEKDTFTIMEFIKLTKDSYNGDKIKRLLDE